ncbi:hypothetical protein STENM36S_05174 [Streptomyces tendae]
MTDTSPADAPADKAGEAFDGPPAGLRALLPDLSPGRASRDFRRLWVSGLITNFDS